MKKYVCDICKYVYDEAKGDEKGKVAPGTKWEDVSADWRCPICRAAKCDFTEEGKDN